MNFGKLFSSLVLIIGGVVITFSTSETVVGAIYTVAGILLLNIGEDD